MTKDRTEGQLHRGGYAAVFAALAAAVVVGALLCTALGSVSIAPEKIVEILLGGGSEAERNILTQIRLPRMCMTVLLGGALAVSGYLLQTFFGNPIAGPYVLGISSGAKLAVCAALLFVAGGERQSSGLLMILAAFGGALVTTGAIVLLSHRVRHMASLLAAGIMVGYICNAVTDFLVTFAEDAQIVNLRGWSQGTFSGMDWGDVAAAAMIVTAAMVLTVLCSKPIGGGLRGQHGSRCKAVSSDPDPAVEPSVGLCDGFCGPGVLCRNRGAFPHAQTPQELQAAGDGARLLSCRRGFLPLLRPDCPNGVCADRAGDQHCDVASGRAGGHLHVGSKKEEKEVTDGKLPVSAPALGGISGQSSFAKYRSGDPPRRDPDCDRTQRRRKIDAS